MSGLKHLLDLGVGAPDSELFRCDEKKNLSLQVDAEWRGLRFKSNTQAGQQRLCVCVCVWIRRRKCSSTATKSIVTDLKLCLPRLVPAVIAVLRTDMVGTEVIIPWALLFGEAQ